MAIDANTIALMSQGLGGISPATMAAYNANPAAYNAALDAKYGLAQHNSVVSGDMSSGPSVGSIAGGLAGIYDLYTGIKGTDIDRAREAASLADPFSTQRGQYQQQLQQLLSDPNSFKTDPGYKFALGQGQEAVGNASDALYGTRRTGALAPELAKYTEGYASQEYDKRIQQLMQLSGANSGSPGTAGTLLQGGFDRNQNAIAGGALGALAPIIQWAIGKGLDPSLITKIPGFKIDPKTGQVTFDNGTTGDANQSGWPGDETGPDFTGPDYDYGGSSGGVSDTGIYSPDTINTLPEFNWDVDLPDFDWSWVGGG